MESQLRSANEQLTLVKFFFIHFVSSLPQWNNEVEIIQAKLVLFFYLKKIFTLYIRVESTMKRGR